MYDKEMLRDIILETDCRTIDENGQLYPPSNPIYNVIADRMKSRGSQISSKHIYTILHTDRNGYRAMVLDKWNVSERNSSKLQLNDTVSSADTTNEKSIEANETFSKKFKLVVSAEKYRKMTPEKKVYGERIYWKFQPGWTDVIAETIWQQHALDCVFSFKNNIIYPSNESKYYAILRGDCVECKSKIEASLAKEPVANSDAIFACTVVDICPQLHTGKKKRQLRGERRKLVATRLIKERKAAATFRYEEAKRLKKFGGKDPPILHSGEVVRKAKEQQLLREYGLSFGNPALNLYEQSKNSKLCDTIHKIGLKKFYCMYWTPEQQQIYTARCKGNKNATFILDATGGVAKLKDKHDPVIYLYQCMIQTKEGCVPVFQMLSADQTSLAIGYFLWTILAKGAPIPPIVVTDFGWALLIAVAKIFGACEDLRDYLQKCYDAIFFNTKTLPKTYIRLDVSHIIHMICRWKCLRGQAKAVRNFYKRCIGQAYQFSDLKSLRNFIESILVVALSEYIGTDMEMNHVPSQIRLQQINDVIRDSSFDQDEENVDFDDELDVMNENEIISLETDWVSWAQNIHESAENLVAESINGTTINGCYNPDFAKRLKKQLIPYVPLWTGIMRNHFGRGSLIATSSGVESELADLKERSLKGILPTRPDKFIMQHINLHLDGKLLLVSKESDVNKNMESESCQECTRLSNSSSVSQVQTSSETEKFHLSENVDSLVHNDDKSISSQTTEEAENLDQSLVDNSTDILEREGALEIASPWNTCENWRGKAERIEHQTVSVEQSTVKRRRKPTCLDKCPEWDHVKDLTSSRLPIMKNGGKVIINKITYNLQRTCAFDSAIQLLLNAIATCKAYKDEISMRQIPIVQFAMSVLNKTKLNSNHYKNRAEIILSLNLFRDSITTFTKNIKRVNAECNVAHLMEHLFQEIPSTTYQLWCDCDHKVSHSSVMLPINVDMLLQYGLGFIQKAIDSNSSAFPVCKKCKNKCHQEKRYGPHILIDTSIITDSGYKVCTKKKDSTLNDVSTEIELGGKKYRLVGLVHYMLQSEHYVAYVKSGQYWKVFNDLHNKAENVSSRPSVTPHVLMYAII